MPIIITKLIHLIAYFFFFHKFIVCVIKFIIKDLTGLDKIGGFYSYGTLKIYHKKKNENGGFTVSFFLYNQLQIL